MFNNPSRKKTFHLLKGTPAQVICLSFLAVIAIGTLVLSLPVCSRSGSFTPLQDAFFTATSATCVTGLVVYDTYLYWSPFGQFIILLLIQVGGLGLVTFTSFFNMLMRRKLGLRGMDLAKESTSTDSFADVKKMVRTIVAITLVTEAIGAVLLAFTFIPLYGPGAGSAISVFLSVSAFCNAGFDIMGREGAYVSLTNYTGMPQVYLVIMLLVIFGGLGFLVWRELFYYRKTKFLSLHSRIVLIMTGLLIAVGFFSFTLLEWNNPDTMGNLPIMDKLGAGLFQSVITRTAGFNTIDQAGLTDLSKIVAIALMFIGAAPASTGGGIKVTTIAVIYMTIVSVMRGYDDTIIFRNKVDKKAVYKALTLFLLGLVLVILCSMLLHFGLDTQADTIDVVYEEVSAFGTVGLSTGITGQLSGMARLLLIISMYLGRVGPLAVGISLAMKTSGHKEVLPQGKILIG